MRRHSKQTGLTLIELMVAMAIGMFLVLGAVTVYTQGRQNYQATEGIARLQENMRFALDVLEPDVRLAGYWGMHNEGGAVNAGGVTIDCEEGGDVTAWAINPGAGPAGINAVNNVQAAAANLVAGACPAFAGGVATDTDVLVIRRASSQPVAFDAGEVQVQSNLDGSTIFDNGGMPAGFNDVDPLQMNTYDVIVNAWYVANGSNGADDVPSLRRRTLRGGVMVDEEVIAGVQNMQLQFGIDTDADPDGNVDRYVEPGDPLIATSEILAVRVWLLIRTTDEERGFVDGAIYTPLDSDLDAIGPLNDNFRRMQISKTILLRNS